jgi:hypothetical protein
VEVGIAETKRALALAKRALIKTRRANPYSVQAEMDAEDKIESLEAGLAFATKILKERF